MNFDLCAWAVGPGRCFLYLALDRHQPTDVFSRKDLHTNLNGCWRGILGTWPQGLLAWHLGGECRLSLSRSAFGLGWCFLYLALDRHQPNDVF